MLRHLPPPKLHRASEDATVSTTDLRWYKRYFVAGGDLALKLDHDVMALIAVAETLAVNEGCAHAA